MKIEDRNFLAILVLRHQQMPGPISLKRSNVAAAAGLICALAFPAAAGASFATGVDGSFGDVESNTAVSGSLLAATGAGVYRSQIRWSDIAPTKPKKPTDPTDPAYRWAKADAAVRLAAAGGADPLLAIYRAPAWAEGSHRPKSGYGPLKNQPPNAGSWKPNPTYYGQFAQALAERYSGTTIDPLHTGSTLPSVHLYEAWNEPNYKLFLAPQCSRGRMGPNSGCTARGRQTAVGTYRSLLNSFYAGIKKVNPAATVSTAGLGPYGSSSNGYEIDPQVFAMSLLCEAGSPSSIRAASSCKSKATFDALSIHPYTLSGKPTTKAISKFGGSLGNAADFRRELDFASARHSILPAGDKELWATETGWLTCPPCRTLTSGAKFGLPAATAAAYTSETIYRLWSAGVDTVVWFGLTDTAVWPGGLYYSGVDLEHATPKLGRDSFRFPVFAARTGTKAFAWSFSPCHASDASTDFQVLAKGKWQTVATKTPSADGTTKTAPWTIPAGTTAVRGVSSGTGCSTETSRQVGIAAK